MRKFGSSNGYYLVNTVDAGQIRIWKIENPLSSTTATVSVVATKTLGSYSSISAAVQKDNQNTVDIGDYSISDVVYKDGYLYGAYTAQNTTSNGSMIVYFKINTNNNYNLDINGKIETANKYYYYPVLHPDNDGNIVFAFNESSSDDYIGVAWTTRYAGNSNIEPIQWLKLGINGYYHLLNSENRWGDYCGIALDPANGYRVWICGEWAYSNTEWSTWIGEISTGQTIDYTFANIIYDENTGILNANAAGTLTVNSIPVNSGNTLPLTTGNSYTEKTNNERFPNWNTLGYTYKHNNWNNVFAEKFLLNNLEANSSNTNQKAFFKSLNYAKIEVKLEGQLISGKGAGEFQDPWFVFSNGSQPGNYWIPCTATYEPNGKEGATEKGVFLNQGYNPITYVWTPPYYSVKASQTQNINLGGTLGTRAFYFQNWSANTAVSASLQNANALETGIVFKEPNATVSANYKGTQLSNTSTAFANNSQRKFVRTSDGTLHLVYESLGHVWYERSTDNGVTWFLANNGKPLDVNGGKLPALDSRGTEVAIVWQEKEFDSEAATLKVALFSGYLMRQYYPLIVFADGSQSYSQNLNPVIAYDYQGRATIAWENKVNYTFPVGIVVKHGPLGWYPSNPPNWVTDYVAAIPSTNSNCVNPTISAAKNPTDQYNMAYNLAWQYNQSSSNSSLNFCKISANTSGVVVSNISTPSTGAGFWLNYNPSIVSMNDNTARLVWTGYTPWYGYRTIYNYNNTSGIWSSSIINMGSNVLQSNINSTDDGKFVIGWVQNNPFANKLVKSDNIYTINNFSTTGNNLQINNASSYSTMYAMAFQNQTVPYSFKLAYLPTLLKTNSLTVSKGRAEVITHKGTDYCFGIGDIVADGQSIDFVSLNSLKTLPDEDTLNYFLRTDDFDITDNSNITFSLFHGMINSQDTTHVINSFSDDDYINVKTVIVDAKNNKVLALISSSVIKKGESFSPDIAGYKFNPTGIGSRKVRLELRLDNNIQMQYTINDFFGNGSSLGFLKSTIREITYNGDEIITTYALDQNYPNPFNPATTITYQLPKSGSVTLKIFDILGNEVRTLVNEQKEMGKYTVQFDASSLASGMYVYQLRVNDYTSTKKMLLLK